VEVGSLLQTLVYVLFCPTPDREDMSTAGLPNRYGNSAFLEGGGGYLHMGIYLDSAVFSRVEEYWHEIICEKNIQIKWEKKRNKYERERKKDGQKENLTSKDKINAK
jgi:hypothetical protein